jgi:hypothetical protein
MSHRRMSLICLGERTPDRDWNVSRNAPSRIVITEQLSVVRYVLGADAAELGLDIERIIIDQATTSDDFLDLLSELPHHFNGDVLYLRPDGSGYLSATGRGDGRVLYSLKSHDVRFYLETAQVVTGRLVFPTLQHAPRRAEVAAA